MLFFVWIGRDLSIIMVVSMRYLLALSGIYRETVSAAATSYGKDWSIGVVSEGAEKARGNYYGETQ